MHSWTMLVLLTFDAVDAVVAAVAADLVALENSISAGTQLSVVSLLMLLILLPLFFAGQVMVIALLPQNHTPKPNTLSHKSLNPTAA